MNSLSSKMMYILGLSSLIISIVVFPNSVGPYTIIKFQSLALLGLLIFVFIIFKLRVSFKDDVAFHIFLLLFLLAGFSQFFFSEESIYYIWRGSIGRGTGFATYLSLCLLIFVSAHIGQKQDVSPLLKSLGAVTYLQVLVGYLQYLKVEPVASEYGFGLVGTLGNSNFLSALLGIGGIYLILDLLRPERQMLEKIIPTILFLYVLIVLYWTHSSQGFFYLLIGIITYALLNIIFYQKAIYFKWLVFASSLAFFILAFLALFNRGPFARIIFDGSMQDRQNMWRTAFRAFLDRPLFGWGFDTHSIWSNRFADSATKKSWNEGWLPADAAHNVFLDFASYGGIFLFGAFIGIQVIVLITFLKALVGLGRQDRTLKILISIWVALQAENLISINYIPNAVWEFILTGALNGYSRRLILEAEALRLNHAGDRRNRV